MGILEVLSDRLRAVTQVLHLSLPVFLLASVIIVYALYSLTLAVYRLYFSPLAKFPGPRLAAASDWYEVYWDLFSNSGEGGQFTRHIKKLHEKYGPIVRITPRELHIDDPDFHSEIYCASTRTKPMDKSTKFKYRFGIPDATFSTTHAEQHSERRAALSPFFSKQRIRSLHGSLSEIVERILYRLATEYSGTGKVVSINDLWSSMTMDITTALAFSRSVNCSAAIDFKSPLSKGMQNITWGAHWTAHFKFLNGIMSYVPDPVMGYVLPPFKPILDFQANIRAQVADILADRDVKSETSHPTIFHDIIASSFAPADKSLERLTDEAISINGAGIETTKWALTVATFNILDNPDVDTRLKAELTEVMPEPASILSRDELQKLPYLTAVINETLRFPYGQVHRIPRINRLHPVRFQDWVIPPGIAISMDAYSVHSNETVFPDPHAFQPERWLGNPRGPGGAHPLSNYLVSFGRGSRVCLGKELAYMELYVALAAVFRRFELELFETTRDDADFVLDIVVPMPPRKSKGVRVIVK